MNFRDAITLLSLVADTVEGVAAAISPLINVAKEKARSPSGSGKSAKRTTTSASGRSQSRSNRSSQTASTEAGSTSTATAATATPVEDASSSTVARDNTSHGSGLAI